MGMIFYHINLLIMQIRRTHIFMDIDRHSKQIITKRFLILITHVKKNYLI